MNVLLGVTGCIAAYKAVEVMRTLQKAGASVQVVMTEAATRFVAPLTFEALSGRRVVAGMFGPGQNAEIDHIRLAQECDLFAVVPATANALGKFAHGIADDFLSTLYLSCPAPVLLAPAMNVEMWRHAAVQQNMSILRSRGHHVVEPVAGPLACGMEGEGKLAEVEAIASRILELVSGGAQPLRGMRVLVTGGPTVEDIDPVRFISNRSSGKMGYAIAGAARRRGAEVILVSGPVDIPAPAGVQVIRIRSAAEMLEAVMRHFHDADIVVKAAAVADYRPERLLEQKAKKTGEPATLRLVPTEDILAMLGRQKTRQILVGFAAETENVVARAKEKMARKRADLMVANDVSGGAVFAAGDATVHIIGACGEVETLELKSKDIIADRVLDRAAGVLAARRQPVSE